MLKDYVHLHSGTSTLGDLKDWRGHIYYGKVYSVEHDGYYDEWHENPNYKSPAIYRPHSREYVEWKFKDEIRNILGKHRYIDSQRVYVNSKNPDEYMIVVKCKKNGLVENALRKTGFTVIKVCHD